MREQQNHDMDDYLKSFSCYLFDYRKNLNKQGIWLFLATLGCWSVPDGWLRLTAMSVTFLIFSTAIFIEWKEEGKNFNFKEATKLVEKKISLLSEDDDKAYWTIILNNIKKKQLNTLKAIKEAYIYICSFTFYVICFWEMFIKVKEIST